ncbi:MAG: hypothetical protein ACE5I8_01975, partial [Thermodesulfobacteriota bacterium]
IVNFLFYQRTPLSLRFSASKVTLSGLAGFVVSSAERRAILALSSRVWVLPLYDAAVWRIGLRS